MSFVIDNWRRVQNGGTRVDMGLVLCPRCEVFMIYKAVCPNCRTELKRPITPFEEYQYRLLEMHHRLSAQSALSHMNPPEEADPAQIAGDD